MTHQDYVDNLRDAAEYLRSCALEGCFGGYDNASIPIQTARQSVHEPESVRMACATISDALLETISDSIDLSAFNLADLLEYLAYQVERVR